MEFERICAYHESGCSLEICQLCGEPCFAGAEVSLDVYLPQIPKRDKRNSCPKSKSPYNWRSVSQYVKVSNPLWDLWPDITFCLKVVFWKLLSRLSGAPSLTRGRVCHLSFSVCSNLPVFTSSIYVTCVLHFSNLYTIDIKLHSVPSE
jgi:hypothetical protein